MLIVFGGLPGSGKSAIAQALARRIGACYLRVDTIEEAIVSSSPLTEGQNIGPAGYVAVYGLAADNLRLGRAVIADSVNPIETTRAAFRDVALETGSNFLEVEVVCSDATTHRYRAETRSPPIEGRANPTWAEIQERDYEPWSADLRLDTFLLSIEESVAEVTKLL
ncbi:AAA family ATPase [Rhizobium sp. SAFR-030]|uniref:AAA family ATPase n=1 Tax=Rhizobium sp. SAFR-030 TaxID=3387277 RepID=UPI003F7E560A